MFQYTIDKQLGLFSEQEPEVNPLAVYEGCSIEAKPPFVAPHHLWVQVSHRCLWQPGRQAISLRRLIHVRSGA